jgi:2'-5' RNA ligase
MRLFLATTFPPDVLRPVNDRIAAVRSKLPSASWTRPEAQHLTLAFLGDRDEKIVEKLTPLVSEAVAAVPRFDATVQGYGFFPNPRHARVGWVGVEPGERFTELALAVRGAVTAAGIELDRGEFRPHLTLCRIRDRWPPLSIETFCRALRDYQSDSFPVDKVTFFASRLSPNGAVHTPMREFILSEAKDQ